jgi:hypothetical protein
MKTAAAELETGFIETEETRAWDAGHSGESQTAG